MGRLLLIPVPIDASRQLDCIPPATTKEIARLRCFAAENARSARRVIGALLPGTDVRALRFIECGTDLDAIALQEVGALLQRGEDVGLLSEAGCPGVADPGQALVALAHSCGALVVPLVGPSAILLALMASGLDGNRFTFNGYLPVQEEPLSARLHELEQRSRTSHTTEIFIETPYRSDRMWGCMLRTLSATTRACAAIALTSPDQRIVSGAIGSLRQNPLMIGKRPTVFLLHATESSISGRLPTAKPPR